ncbi:hypothetical protein VPIG_00152 [Vibrio phage PWH3a-P1]|uniref:hypothetical protein n=1 Tax=Vibrio phage PWH3a-P1 TaxID=754058 RepID=UPI0002C12628|nr:hypothetical protein VPIG_00152 [Vibrio phage PWH3a-P1]AGH32009.1 hypothetical protein VPIG_00152 [Vibrio phage PWH3a-P1]
MNIFEIIMATITFVFAVTTFTGHINFNTKDNLLNRITIGLLWLSLMFNYMGN